MHKILNGILLLSTALTLGACTQGFTKRDLVNKGDYWQRANVSSAVYMRGEKAQQILHRDISTCVVELKELQRLGSVNEAFPAGLTWGGQPMNPETPMEYNAKYDTSHKNQAMLNEVFEYTNFETCMREKGWERTESMPYPRARAARGNFIKTILDPLAPPPPEDKPYSGRTYSD